MRDIDKTKAQLIRELAATRQRVAELEWLRTDEKRHYQFLRSLHEGIWVLDKDDRTTFVNPRMAEMLGYAEDEMLGKPVFSFMDEEGVKLTSVHMERRKHGIKEQLDFEFICKDGGRIHTLLETSPIIDDDGTYIGSIAGVQDITERRQLEEQIRQQKDFLTNMLESLPHPFYVVNANDYTIKMANSAAAFDRISEKSTCYALTHGRSKPCKGREHLCPLQEIKKTKRPVIVEHIHYDRQGIPTNVEVHAYPILDEEGRVTEVIEYALDITERRHTEEARAEKMAALARAKELQRSRQRIVSAQESLRRDIAQQLHGSVQNRLVILMHQLQELQQVAPSGELSRQLNKVYQDISELLENQLRPIAYQLYPSIMRRGLVAALRSLRDRMKVVLPIDLEIDDELMQQEKHNNSFISEPVRLAAYRIAEEILSNAVKHSKASRVTIGLSLSPKRLLHLIVRDDGHGFDVKSVSVGLGIPFMQDYAELIGGRCIIHSAPEKGTEVTAILPLVMIDEEHSGRAIPLE